jgi:Flp pilus assembly protein TadG
MKRAAAIRRRGRRQDGQALVVVALAMVVLLGFTGLVLDIGRVWVAQRHLQAAVDSAALVAGQDLPNATTAYNQAVSYSAATGDKNALGGYGVTAGSPSVTFECVSHAPNYTAGSPPACPADTSSTSCQPSGAQSPQPSGVTTCNAVNVKETATVKTTFLGLFLPSFNVHASSTAAARGGAVHPINAYVILDNTGSMTNSCSASVTGISNPNKLDCAKAGVRALLQALWPCSSSLSSCGTATANTGGQLGANVAAPVDEVGMLVIPAISGNPPATSTLDKEIDCNKNSSFTTTYPTWTPYTYPAAIPAADQYLGYQAVGLSSDYRPSVANTALSSTTSNLVESVDWGQCSGGTYPGGDYYGLKDIGGQGSYLAGAITEAQNLLNQNTRPGVTNAIIILSDGELNNPKSGFSKTPCSDAVNAATQAKAAGSTIYTIAYDSSTAANSCGPDSPTDSYDVAETVLADIASNSQTFFNQPTSGDLTQAFQQVGTDLTDSRLIPDCTAAPPGC